MADSFQLYFNESEYLAPLGRLVMTGAGGRIGRAFLEHEKPTGELLLIEHPDADAGDLAEEGDFREGDLTDPGFLPGLLREGDTVLHLAADPNAGAEWDSLIPNNIEATRRLFEEAADVWCRRVVFASSIHAVSAYHAGHQVHPDEPVNPGDRYGVTKCFGEAMARYCATQQGLSTICIRIGAFQPSENARPEESLPLMNSFVSHRDLCQLLRLAVEDCRLRLGIFHGVSNNVFNRLDIQSAREFLGYAPRDDFAEINEVLGRLALRQQVRPHTITGEAP